MNTGAQPPSSFSFFLSLGLLAHDGADYIQGEPSLLLQTSLEMSSGFTQECVSYVTLHLVKLTIERDSHGE